MLKAWASRFEIASRYCDYRFENVANVITSLLVDFVALIRFVLILVMWSMMATYFLGHNSWWHCCDVFDGWKVFFFVQPSFLVVE